MQTRSILKGECLSGVVVASVPTDMSVNGVRQCRLRVKFSENGSLREITTENVFLSYEAENFVGREISVYFKDNMIVTGDYKGRFQAISVIAIILIIVDIGLVLIFIVLAVRRIRKKTPAYNESCNNQQSSAYNQRINKKKTPVNNKVYKRYQWYYEKPGGSNSGADVRQKQSVDNIMRENEHKQLRGEVINNNINLDGIDFLTETSAAQVLPHADKLKTDVIAKPAGANPAADLRPANIADGSYAILEEMLAAADIFALDALWTKHSNHMPFSDYVAVKREYENIRRTLK